MAGQLAVNDVIYLDGRAGIQFRFRPIVVRVTRVLDDLPGREGIWITGYELDPATYVVVDRRELYIPNMAGVQYHGSVSVGPPSGARRTAGASAG